MKDQRPLQYQIIDTPAKLEAVIPKLLKQKTLGMDLEADSMYHFKEKVCLLQIAAKNLNVVIDPLQVQDLAPLRPVFDSPDIQKIFHGADYDVRSLYRDFRIEINHLFDTQLACRFLGIRETGLEAVLKQRFNIQLDKGYQKKDWSERPLPLKMLEYAARDVIFLLPLARILEKELRQKNRLAWVAEECNLLSRVRPVSIDNEPLCFRYKGAGRLMPRKLAVLEAVLQFRKKIAKEKDKPLFKVFGNAAVLKIALAAPLTLPCLNRLGALSQKQIRMFGRDLIGAVSHALELPETELPVYPRNHPPVVPESVPRRIKALKKWRDAFARELDMDPTILLTKANLNTLAVGNPLSSEELECIGELKNWQISAFGDKLVAILKAASDSDKLMRSAQSKMLN